MSESHIVHNPDYFLNVEKMVLLEGLDKPKIRSNTLAVNLEGISEEKSKGRKGYKDIVESRSLIKDINLIKEKLNINKVLALHQ